MTARQQQKKGEKGEKKILSSCLPLTLSFRMLATDLLSDTVTPFSGRFCMAYMYHVLSLRRLSILDLKKV